MKQCSFLVFMAGLSLFALEFASVFNNGMVLQRGMPVNISGKGQPGEKLVMEFAGQRVAGVVDEQGKWNITLAPLNASGTGRPLILNGSREKLVLNDVLVGEVWLCSGQSNMHWPLDKSLNGADVASRSDFAGIRIFSAPIKPKDKPQDKVDAVWRAVSPETAGKMSAIGYYFARDLHLDLQIPIGLLEAHWGGTMIEAWTPTGAWDNFPEVKAQIKAQYCNPPKASSSAPRDWPENQPSVLYNSAIHPMTPFTIRGVIWYQGCSNVWYSPAETYLQKQQALFEGLKLAFRNPELSFLLVQLAPLKRGGLAAGNHLKIWSAQQQFALDNRNVHIAIINDVGDLDNIHPVFKEPVGHRLELLALKHTYQMPILADSPVFEKAEPKGTGALLRFSNVQAWHTTDGRPMRNFSLAGDDGKFYPASAVCEGASIMVSSEKVPRPAKVRYLWTCSALGNVINEIGLPLAAFEAVLNK